LCMSCRSIRHKSQQSNHQERKIKDGNTKVYGRIRLISADVYPVACTAVMH
jgi:hypothetical protein